MQPQPETPSPVEPPSDAAAAPEERSEQGTQVSNDQNWFRRLWRRGSPEPEPQDAPATNVDRVSDAVTLTQEEFDRRVQAEADRREAARNDRARSDRRRKLRDENPWQYAEEDRNAETVQAANQQVGDFFASVSREHDKYSLDPIVEALTDADRKRILELEGAGHGLEGRKLIVTEGLKALEKQWKADGARDAEDRLRKNPAFRKQLLNEIRRNGVREPELISGTASSGDQSISNLLREQLRR
jgi:hypothetical protein